MVLTMGQRQDLLAGAKQCIAEKGYSRTTARDIIAVSGANLAAIGYHFGSKDALLNAAVLESFNEWGDAIEQAMTDPATGAPIDRLEHFLTGLLSGAEDRRTTLVSSVQLFAEAEFVPELREQLVGTYEHGSRAIAAMLLDIDIEDVDEVGRQLGLLALAVMNGAVLQWLIAPETTPTGREFAAALRTLVSAPAALPD